MFQSILLFNEPWFSMGPGTKVNLHAFLQFLALVCASGAFYSIYQGKIERGAEHFQSTHGFWGLITFATTCMAYLGGIAAKYFTFFRGCVKQPAFIKVIHAAAGIVTYLLGDLTVCLIVFSEWWDEHYSSWLRLVVLSIVIGSTFYVLRKPLSNVPRRYKKLTAKKD